MNNIEIKKEIINRYKYIYENVEFILLPYVYKEEKLIYYNTNKLSNLNPSKIEETIYLKDLSNDLLLEIEDFLLSDCTYNKSKLYKKINKNKKNNDYIEKVNNGNNILNEYKIKNIIKDNESELKLDFWEMLKKLRNFIASQTGDLKNRDKKLIALDEYFKINRYTNNEEIWTSGYELNIRDLFKNNLPNRKDLKKIKSDNIIKRNKKDTGTKKNNFITYLADPNNYNKDNNSILTEKEKQEIYLKYHNETPYNLDKIKKEDNSLKYKKLILSI